MPAAVTSHRTVVPLISVQLISRTRTRVPFAISLSPVSVPCSPLLKLAAIARSHRWNSLSFYEERSGIAIRRHSCCPPRTAFTLLRPRENIRGWLPRPVARSHTYRAEMIRFRYSEPRVTQSTKCECNARAISQNDRRKKEKEIKCDKKAVALRHLHGCR